MENSKREFLPFKYEIHLSKGQSHKTPKEKELMSEKPCASAVGRLMYVILCTGRDIFYVVGIVSQYKSYPKEEHWTIVKMYTRI